MRLPRLIGMIHLGPLPGSPAFGGSLEAVIDRARHDAELLSTAGFPGLMVENFGDAPFFADDVPAVTTATMTRAVVEVRAVTDAVVGVNVLRNDGLAALAVAAATGASMIRVNVLSGAMMTDQGPITGRAAEIARSRSLLAPGVAVLADVFVKHAAAPPGLTLAQAARDTWERGGATALVVSGSGTGHATDPAHARLVREAVPDAPLVVGSGATPQTLAALSEVADAVIVGTALEVDDRPGAPLDPDRVSRVAHAARAAGLI